MPPPQRGLGHHLAHAKWIQHLSPLVLILSGLFFALGPFAIWFITHPGDWWSPAQSKGRHPDSIDRTRMAIVRRKFFYFVWKKFAASFDEQEEEIKAPLLARASGTVLEIGPGLGQNLKYYNKGRVDKIILVEPNPSMHRGLEQEARQAGYTKSDGTLEILGCGGSASDESRLRSRGLTEGSVDTIVLVHVICGLPDPQGAIELYRRLLKSGGQILFFEHVRSEDESTAKVQTMYTHWIWAHLFDGCQMNRPTGEWLLGGDSNKSAGTGGKMIEANGNEDGALRPRKKSSLEGQGVAGIWASYEVTAPPDQTAYTCLPQILGRCVKP